MKQPFYKVYCTLLLLLTLGAYSATLEAQTRTLCYWFDGDPSTLRQDPFGFWQGDEAEIVLNTEGLSHGLHRVSTQAQRADGTCTPVVSAFFIKPKYQQGANGSGRVYAWVGDPNRTLPIIHDVGKEQGLIDISFLIGGFQIPYGLQTLYLQYVSSEGVASPITSARFIHLPRGTERVEVWVDRVGGKPLFSREVERKEGQNLLLLDLSVETAQLSLTPGVHRFYVRYTRSDGGQSPLESAYFLKAPIDLKKDRIQAVRYWFDNDMRTAREYTFDKPCAPGAVQEIELSTRHIPKGKHKISLASVTERGILGQPTTDSIEVMYGLPSAVRLQRLTPDPNALVPEGVMEGGAVLFHYRVVDTLKRAVEGASLLFSLNVEGKKYLFRSSPSDSTGIVTIEVPTARWKDEWKAIGSNDRVYIPVGKIATVQLSKVTFEGYDTPIEVVHNDFKEHKVRCLPLLSRSFSFEMKLGVKGKVGGDIGIGTGEASAALKKGFSFGFERGDDLRISKFSAATEVSASVAGKLKWGKKGASSSKSSSFSGYVGANGKLSYQLSMQGKASGWNLLEALGILYTSQYSAVASRSLLVGMNALRKMLDNPAPSQQLLATSSPSVGWGFGAGVSLKGISLGKKVDLSFSGSLAADFDWNFSGEKLLPSGQILPYKSMSSALALSAEGEADFLNKVTRRKWSTFATGKNTSPLWQGGVEGTVKYKQTQEKTLEPDGETLRELALKDNVSFKFGIVGEGAFFDKLTSLTGVKLSLEKTIKYASALKSKKAMTRLLASKPEAVTEKIFPQIYNPTVAFEALRIYNILNDETTLVSGLKEALQGSTTNYPWEQLTFENKRSIGVVGELEIPIAKGALWTLSVTGSTELELEYPRQESFFSTQDQCFFPSYYYPMRNDDEARTLEELGSWTESMFNLFSEIITPERKETMDRYAGELSDRKEVVVGAGSVTTFTNTSRSYGPALRRYDLLRSAPQEDISHLTFTLAEQSLPSGAVIDFSYFYPAGDLLGVDDKKEQILILSDFFTLKAREGVNDIAETREPFTLRCTVGRDDLALVGFTSDADVHLYYTATDDGVWQDLGSIGKDFTLSKLGTYALGAKMIFDTEPPKLSLSFNQEEKKIWLSVEENVALRDESWYCTINDEEVVLEKIDNNNFVLSLSTEQLKADSLSVLVEVTDRGGNRTQTVATFYPQKDIPVVSIEHRAVSLYPSPVHSILHVRGEEIYLAGEAILYNAQGNQVGVYKLSAPETSIDVNHLPSGVYWLRIKNRSYSFIKE